jgi:hypothetical protein
MILVHLVVIAVAAFLLATATASLSGASGPAGPTLQSNTDTTYEPFSWRKHVHPVSSADPIVVEEDQLNKTITSLTTDMDPTHVTKAAEYYVSKHPPTAFVQVSQRLRGLVPSGTTKPIKYTDEPDPAIYAAAQASAAALAYGNEVLLKGPPSAAPLGGTVPSELETPVDAVQTIVPGGGAPAAAADASNAPGGYGPSETSPDDIPVLDDPNNPLNPPTSENDIDPNTPLDPVGADPAEMTAENDVVDAAVDAVATPTEPNLLDLAAHRVLDPDGVLTGQASAVPNGATVSVADGGAAAPTTDAALTTAVAPTTAVSPTTVAAPTNSVAPTNAVAPYGVAKAGDLTKCITPPCLTESSLLDLDSSSAGSSGASGASGGDGSGAILDAVGIAPTWTTYATNFKPSAEIRQAKQDQVKKKHIRNLLKVMNDVSPTL